MSSLQFFTIICPIHSADHCNPTKNLVSAYPSSCKLKANQQANPCKLHCLLLYLEGILGLHPLTATWPVSAPVLPNWSCNFALPNRQLLYRRLLLSLMYQWNTYRPPLNPPLLKASLLPHSKSNRSEASLSDWSQDFTLPLRLVAFQIVLSPWFHDEILTCHHWIPLVAWLLPLYH